MSIFTLKSNYCVLLVAVLKNETVFLSYFSNFSKTPEFSHLKLIYLNFLKLDAFILKRKCKMHAHIWQFAALMTQVYQRTKPLVGQMKLMVQYAAYC